MTYNSLGSAGALLLAITILPIQAPAQQSDYLPLTKNELGKTFKLKSLGDFDREPPVRKASIGPSGAGLLTVEGNLVVEGLDKKGVRWVVDTGIRMPGLGGRMYIGDLDKDGSNDLAIVTYTGACGLAPSRQFKSVMFDSLGRPVIFEADGYFDDRDDGVGDLVDMDGDGKAELIYMNFDGGYWITNLYKADNARWERVTGPFRRRSFPLYTRFTRRPNHKAVQPARGRHPFAPNLSNRTPVLTGRLLSFRQSGTDEAKAIEFTVGAATGKKTKCEPDPWYESFAMLVDDEKGREIVSLGAPAEKLRSLMSRIVEKRYRVAVFGRRRANECSPELLWASRQ